MVVCLFQLAIFTRFQSQVLHHGVHSAFFLVELQLELANDLHLNSGLRSGFVIKTVSCVEMALKGKVV